jgi:branched-chain amino acid transport system substrate-binding protein
MKRARLTTAAVATVAACVLAACGGGSSGDNSSGGSGGGSSNSAEGVTANSVTIEGDIVKTSAVGYSQKLAELGAKARFQRTNDEGGVNGRKINYLGAVDNHLDPSQDLSTIKKVVQQDKAFAVVPLISPVLAQGGQFLVQNKIPFYGWGITPAYCNTESGFGFSGCLVPTTADNEISGASSGLIDKLLGIKDGSGKTVAMVSEDSTSGTFGIKVIEAAYVADKWKVTYAKATIPAGSPTTDFTPYAQAILTSNGGKAPDVVVHVTTAPNVIGLSNALTRAGFKGPQENAVTYDPSYLANPASKAALEGGYVFLQYGSFQGDSSANQQMLKDVQAVDPGQKELTQDIAIGYYSADIFLHHLQKAGKNLSRAAFLKAANDGSSYEVPGGLGKVSYPENHKNSVPCGSLVQISGGKYVEKVPLTCFTNTSLSVLKG